MYFLVEHHSISSFSYYFYYTFILSFYFLFFHFFRESFSEDFFCIAFSTIQRISINAFGDTINVTLSLSTEVIVVVVVVVVVIVVVIFQSLIILPSFVSLVYKEH